MPRDPDLEASARAREARKIPSAAEHIMWQHLRGSRTGFKFRREHPLSGFRLDFYCHEALLCVEMDGEQHNAVRDERRDQALAELGILTYRIANPRFFLLPEAEYRNDLAEIVRVCEVRSGRKAFPKFEGRLTD